MREWLEHASFRQLLLTGVAGAVLFELATCLCRFGLSLQAARQTSWLAPLTFGLRIHHGYVGLVCLLLAALPCAPLPRHLLAILGLTLFLSDLVHHGVVLPFAVSATEFDIFYPPPRA